MTTTITRSAGIVGAFALGLSALAGGSALADGSTVKPTKDQKAAIVKAWSKADGGTAYSGPLKCIRVDLSATNKNRAGLRSNGQKSGCSGYAFDGSAILYGHKQKKWFLMAEGSSISQAQCKAMSKLLGVEVWGDLVDYAAGMGCENID